MRRPSSVRTWIVTAAAALGVSVGVAGLAGAATDGSTTTTPAAATATTPAAPSGTAPDPSTMKQGPGETLLTGDTAAKVTAAAKAALPGATVIRVETDAGGAAYEAHMQKADGTQVTLKFDSSFKVTATEDGFGSGPGGHAPPTGSGATVRRHRAAGDGTRSHVRRPAGALRRPGPPARSVTLRDGPMIGV